MELLDVLYAAGRWSLEAFWLPLAAWTAIALPAYAAVRFSDDRSPHVRYWTLVALLFSLPLGVAAAAIALFDAPANGIALVTLPAAVTVTAPTAAPAAFTWTAWHSAGAAVSVAFLLALWRGGVLAFGFFELRALRRSSDETPAWIADETSRLANGLGLTRRVAVSVQSTPSPFTVGWMRPLIVLPRELVASRDDLRFALTHELIHIQRRDFGLQVAEQLIGAVFYFHPLVSLIRRESSVLREITCDADVLSRTGERSAYARVLCRYSTSAAGERTFAVIFSREHQLPKRIRAMQTFLSERGITRSKQKGFAVFALLLTVAVAAVACSDLLVDSAQDLGEGAIGEQAAADAQSEATGEEIFVIVEEMPELIGGLASIQENLTYPELAKNAGIEGRVIIQFIVDEEGQVIDPRVVRGIGSGLDAAALEAVRTARFKPGKQRGVAVPVKISLPVTFRLGEDASSGADDQASVLQLRIDARDQLYVAGEPVAIGQLAQALRNQRITSETVVSLRLEQGASPSILSDVQEIVRSTEAQRIQYASEQQAPQAVRQPLRLESVRRDGGVVTGRVLDSAGNPVPGASVFLPGTSRGAATDRAGGFRITPPAEYASEGILQASHVSHETAEVNYRFEVGGGR